MSTCELKRARRCVEPVPWGAIVLAHVCEGGLKQQVLCHPTGNPAPEVGSEGNMYKLSMLGIFGSETACMTATV